MGDDMKSFFKLTTMISILFLTGCSGCGDRSEGDDLIRIGQRVVTVADFSRALEVAKVAYPHSSMQNPEEVRETQLRLLNQMTEEMILLQRASESNIGVSDAEVEEAVEKIKSDYPDNVFEETLMEYAVSYKVWRDGLKNRLLMEKLVEQELRDEVAITADEIAEFYRDFYDGDSNQPSAMQHSEEIEEIIVKQLRRRKIELAYKKWMDSLRGQYTVEINRKEWDKLLKSAE